MRHPPYPPSGWVRPRRFRSTAHRRQLGCTQTLSGQDPSLIQATRAVGQDHRGLTDLGRQKGGFWGSKHGIAEGDVVPPPAFLSRHYPGGHPHRFQGRGTHLKGCVCAGPDHRRRQKPLIPIALLLAEGAVLPVLLRHAGPARDPQGSGEVRPCWTAYLVRAATL